MHGRVSLATLAAALLLAAPASAELPGGNLVVNPGAEAGAAATDSSSQLPLPGWTVTSTFTPVAYGASGFLTTEDAERFGGGESFFAGGNGGDVASAAQVINLAAAASDLDKGGVTATLSALLGGFASQDDSATVSAQPLDAAGAALAAPIALAPVLQAERKGVTTLVRRTATVPVPAGTRAVLVTITATRISGQYNDGYADNVSLTFGPGTPAAGKSVAAVAVSGTVLVRAPGAGTFAPLDPSVIKNGAEIDARKGRVELTRSDGGKAQFYDGIFKLSQAGGLTTVTLSEELDCPRAGRASAVAQKPKTRKLWGDGKGKFRTKGSYSAATVRGTKWLVQDTCTTTLTRVTEGVVQVQDLVKKTKVTVRKGKRYTARARR